MRDYDDRANPVISSDDDGYELPRELVKGDPVIHRNIGTKGFLVDNPDKNGNVNVLMGTVKMRVNVRDLKLNENEENEEKKKKKDYN